MNLFHHNHIIWFLFFFIFHFYGMYYKRTNIVVSNKCPFSITIKTIQNHPGFSGSHKISASSSTIAPNTQKNIIAIQKILITLSTTKGDHTSKAINVFDKTEFITVMQVNDAIKIKKNKEDIETIIL